MFESNSVLFMIVLDSIMILYTAWVLLTAKAPKKLIIGMSTTMGAWLIALHLIISNKLIFPDQMNGILFLGSIFLFVGIVGATLFIPKSSREFFLSTNQQTLMLLQGIRVFFGAGFLMQAALGGLPTTFGIIDGFSHIIAGFLGFIGAIVVLQHATYSNRALWFCNLFGMIDILVVASSISLILLPTMTANHSMMYAVFLPAPLWVCYHAISFGKLFTQNRSEFATQNAQTALSK